jgi:hypothetical protein
MLRVLEKRVLGMIFRHKGQKTTENWGKMHSEKIIDSTHEVACG